MGDMIATMTMIGENEHGNKSGEVLDHYPMRRGYSGKRLARRRTMSSRWRMATVLEVDERVTVANLEGGMLARLEVKEGERESKGEVLKGYGALDLQWWGFIERRGSLLIVRKI